MTTAVDPRSPTPLYRQLANLLRERRLVYTIHARGTFVGRRPQQ
jgi:hypothetical protein